MKTMKKFDLRINGFSVVASEVYQLAEKARESTREIRSLVKGIQTSITEAVSSMERSRKEVATGMQRAESAGSALREILGAVEGVSIQAMQALEAVASMGKLSVSLQSEFQTFNRILQGNNKAVEDLNNGYRLIARTMESTAISSEENSAASQEVFASAEEMRSQMEQVADAAKTLEGMSVQLHSIVARFKLDAVRREEPIQEAELISFN
jgi:methyl-accepting chemotaxis protein